MKNGNIYPATHAEITKNYAFKRFIKKIINVLGYDIKKIEPSVKQSNIKVLGDFKTSVLRKQQNNVLKHYISTLTNIKTVINIGAKQNDTNKEGKLYKEYFPNNVEFFTLDKNRFDNDEKHFMMDLHDLGSLQKKFDLVLFMSTLEHVENPFIVSEQLKRIISPGGYLFISVPFFYPIHKDVNGRYSDYWRFTDDGLRILFKDMTELSIIEMDSVLVSVQDRNIYWEDKATTVSGYCALFRMSR